MKNIKNNIISFVKKETVLTISALLAVISMIFVPPNSSYAGYVNYSVIAMLFCLMITVQGFSGAGFFRFVSARLTSQFSGARQLSAILIMLCFFSSMLITNDVSLITFVPLTIMLFKGRQELLIRCIILETAAANLGSMLTPVGNPQNLFLYSHYGYSLGGFLMKMLPATLISLALLLLSVLLIPKVKISVETEKEKFSPDAKLFMYSGIFLLCLLEVAHILDYRICLVATVLLCIIFDRKIFAKPDYALLATFVCFFIFVGNVSAIEPVRNFIASAINGRELLSAAALSQIISNVPCAVMLSGFTDCADSILIGVNIGGMGTLIASLASLISYRFYARSDNAHKGRYFVEFTIYNFAFLAILIGLSMLIYQ